MGRAPSARLYRQPALSAEYREPGPILAMQWRAVSARPYRRIYVLLQSRFGVDTGSPAPPAQRPWCRHNQALCGTEHDLRRLRCRSAYCTTCRDGFVWPSQLAADGGAGMRRRPRSAPPNAWRGGHESGSPRATKRGSAARKLLQACLCPAPLLLLAPPGLLRLVLGLLLRAVAHGGPGLLYEHGGVLAFEGGGDGGGAPAEAALRLPGQVRPEDGVRPLRQDGFEGGDRSVGDRFEGRVRDPLLDVSRAGEVYRHAVALKYEDYVGVGRPAVGDEVGRAAQRRAQHRRDSRPGSDHRPRRATRRVRGELRFGAGAAQAGKPGG